MTLTMACGHFSETPRNMGRGAARQKRLNAYVARPCLTCAITAIEEYAYSLTVPSSEHNPDAYRRKIIAREEAKLSATY